jgi:hypothetical protein
MNSQSLSGPAGEVSDRSSLVKFRVWADIHGQMSPSPTHKITA